jgi:ammonia channel protein AmtB
MRPAEVSALLGGVLIAVALFEPWFEFAAGRQDAWNAVTAAAIVAALAAAGALALGWLTVTQRSPSAPLAAAVLTSVVALLAVVLIAVDAASPPAGTLERSFGLWLGLAGAVLVLVSAWWSLRDERPFWGVPV